MIDTLVGYIENGKALDKMWKPFFREIREGVVTEIKIFDEDNNLMLEEDEQIIMQVDNDKVDIIDDWKARGRCYEFVFKGYLGKGITIITNKRMVHYRTPDPVMAGMDHFGPGGLPAAISDPIKAKSAKQRGMYEFCEISFDEIVRIVLYLHSQTVEYYIMSNWIRYKISNDNMSWDIFKIVEDKLKNKELERESVHKVITNVNYIDSDRLVIKKHWKRDDLIKKANKYRNRKKYDKAIIQYQKILEIFPADGDTKKKLEELSRVK